MPRPRFYKLSTKKRERILQAAAKEFGAHGFESASLNAILDEAGISKGAAYYYFDDKADLFATTVHFYGQELLDGSEFDVSQLTAENYWDAVTELYRRQFTTFADRPWAFGVVKAGGLPEQGPLAELAEQAQSLLMQLLRHGRDLGMVRTDLPEALLLTLVVALDDAHDRWLYAHWAELSAADLDQAAGRMTDTLRRLLAPA